MPSSREYLHTVEHHNAESTLVDLRGQNLPRHQSLNSEQTEQTVRSIRAHRLSALDLMPWALCVG